MGEAVDVIPEAPAEVREDARYAFWEVQMLRDDARALAFARERIRNVNSPRGVAGLDLRLGGGLWEGRELDEPDFARLPFEEKKQRFMSSLPEALASLGVEAGGPGQRDHGPYHAAGVLLLSWWRGEGHKITANLGRGSAKLTSRQPKPSATVRFLANEFLDIARWYGSDEWAIGSDGYENPQATGLPSLPRGKMEQIAFKVAAQHIKDRTAFR